LEREEKRLSESKRNKQDDPSSGTPQRVTEKGRVSPRSLWSQKILSDPEEHRSDPQTAPSQTVERGSVGADYSLGSKDKGCLSKGQSTPGDPEMEFRAPKTPEDGDPEVREWEEGRKRDQEGRGRQERDPKIQTEEGRSDRSKKTQAARPRPPENKD
jgi:hypothetical protein